MGYAILNISELHNFDFTNLNDSIESVRKSIDGNFFIIEGENVNQYTHEEILLITQNPTWNQLI
jgi:hypothetical protein